MILNSLKIILLVAFSMAYLFGLCQSVTIAYGPAYTTTKIIEPVAGNKKIADANATDVFSISYEHFTSKKPFSIITSYSKFDGYTFVFFAKGSATIPVNQEVVGSGYRGVEVFRYDIGVAYTLAKMRKKFYFTPNLSIGLQHSKPNGEDIWPFEISGPDIVETEPTSAETFKTSQIVPSIGFRTGFVFWNRLDIGLSFQGVLGYKPYQKMYFKYEYKGVPQKTGEFEANGTGLFVTLGIGYRFAKLIK